MRWAMHFKVVGIGGREDGTKINLKELDSESVNCGHLAQDGTSYELGLLKIRVVYLLTEQHLASQKELFSAELVAMVCMNYKCSA